MASKITRFNTNRFIFVGSSKICCEKDPYSLSARLKKQNCAGVQDETFQKVRLEFQIGCFTV